MHIEAYRPFDHSATKIRLVLAFDHFNVRSRFGEIETRERCAYMFEQREREGERKARAAVTKKKGGKNIYVHQGTNGYAAGKAKLTTTKCLLSVEQRYTK